MFVQGLSLSLLRAFINPEMPTIGQERTSITEQPFDLLESYRSFRQFLGKCVGPVACLYGITAGKTYFAILGTSATVLFWILGRLQRSSSTKVNATLNNDDVNRP